MTEKARLDPVRLIWPLRMANVIGRGLARLGLRPSLDPDRLEARARRMTGYADFGDGGHREPLERLCAELDASPRLTTAGRLTARDHLVRGLGNLLLLTEARRREPDLVDGPIQPPLLVIGLPRSGTTFLHRVLCDVPGALPLLTWQGLRPVPPFDGPDGRLAKATQTISAMRRMAPGLDAKHHLDPVQPEECMTLLDTSMASLTFGFLLPAYGYTEWLYTRDGLAEYRCWREPLTLLQRSAPDGRLTLKAPTHTAFLDAIWHYAPETMVVHPHRDPVSTVGSLCSLFFTTHSLAVDEVDRARLGQCMLEICGRMIERNLADRAKHPDQRIVDVDYRALVADPAGTVAGIHGAFGLPFGEVEATAIDGAIAARPQHAFGRHDYALEDFGLTPTAVRDRLAAYYERFGSFFEG